MLHFIAKNSYLLLACACLILASTQLCARGGSGYSSIETHDNHQSFTIQYTGYGRHNYHLELPAEANNVVIHLQKTRGEVYLYVKSGSRPTESYYDCTTRREHWSREWSRIAKDGCEFLTPTDNHYYLMLSTHGYYNEATLTVIWETTKPEPESEPEPEPESEPEPELEPPVVTPISNPSEALPANTNGLIRQYFPKSTYFKHITIEDI